jgi:tetratricopeptide (TPR) repeat protein
MLRFVAFLSLILLANGKGLAVDVLGLINEGHREEAIAEVARLSNSTGRDGSTLLAQALLETDGRESIANLQEALKTGVSPEQIDKLYYLMVQYYLAEGDHAKLTGIAEDYLKRREAGEYRPHIQRLIALAYGHMKIKDKSEMYRNRLIKENSADEKGLTGKIDQAGDLYEAKKIAEARKISRKLADSDYDMIAAPALYLLSLLAEEQNNTDDAILYYNLLKDGYPHAIGLDDLADRFSRMEKVSTDHSAEKITGTIYSVQAGVFSKRENAATMAGRLKRYSQPVEISDKIISGKKYHVVYVGRFLSSEKALELKTRLEAEEKDAFQVVAR